MRLITLDKDGRFSHQWIASIHGDTIPTSAIKVTEEIFMILSQNPQTKKYDLQTKEVSEYVQPFIFAQALEIKRNEIIYGFKQSLDQISSQYTLEEMNSFPTQEAEAVAWQADNTAPTPFLDLVVANRPGVDKATLVSRIVANSAAYKQIAGAFIGKKQHFEDVLYALNSQQENPDLPDATQAEFDAIVVNFT